MSRALLIAGVAAVGALAYLQRDAILAPLAVDADAMREPIPAAVTPRMAVIRDALGNPNVRALLATIRFAEGTSGRDGYSMLFGGELFEGFADHPRKLVVRLSRGRPIKSTAAGAYQILARTWDMVRGPLALPDFSPQSQDLAAVDLIRRRGALDPALQGRLEIALSMIRKEWASLPGADYGQPEKKTAELIAAYVAAGGRVA